MRYDAVFLDIDGTLLWVNLDVEGFVRDLSPYAANGALTVDDARGPLWDSLHEHIRENIKYPTEEKLARFRRDKARRTARTLGLDAPDDVLAEASKKRTSFNPYPESEEVLEELRCMNVPLYVVSNWDVELEAVLESLGWRRYFDGVIASAKVGVEKPDGDIFEEALRVANVSRERTVMVGNDPDSDVRGAVDAGIDAVLVDRKGRVESAEAVTVLPDLRGLPDLVRG